MTAFDVMTGGSRQPERQTPKPSSTGTPKPQLVGKAEDPPELVVKAYATINIQQNPTTPSPADPAKPASASSSDFFQAAIEHAGIPVVGLDCSGIICCWNQTAARLFGRSANEMIGKTMDLLIPSAYRSIAWRALQRTLQQKSVNGYEMALVPPGGKNSLHIGVTLSCVMGPQGQCQGVMAWLRDITNRKELEFNLLRTRHVASLGTLAAGVAHQFNNIVCGMSTMVEVALRSEKACDMKRALHMSAEAASRISYITQSLLAFSAQDSGEPDLVDLTEELLRFADAVEPTLKNRGIELVLDLKGDRIAAVPRNRFGQVLQHLLRNAEESFEDVTDGRVKRLTISTQSRNDQVLLQFSDTGSGIAAEDLPQILDPFFTTKGVQGGGNKNNPGLGLTLVHGVIMDMGGHIWAESTRTQGTTINILIPVTL